MLQLCNDFGVSSKCSLNSQALHGVVGIYGDTEDRIEFGLAVLAQQFCRSKRIN